MKRFYFFMFFLVVLIESCAVVKSKRMFLSRTIKINETLTVTSTGAVKFFNIDFLPASVLIESDGKIIYIDPFMISEPKPADYIFITHEHMDHFSIKDIKKILKKETQIICPKNVFKKLKEYNAILVKPGDTIDNGNINFTAVASCNIKSGIFGMKAHPENSENTGFVISFDGVRIYHAGDTDFIPEMKMLGHLDAAFIPINGSNLAMSPEDAALFVNELKPKVVIPIHYELGKNYAEKFINAADKRIKIELLQE